MKRGPEREVLFAGLFSSFPAFPSTSALGYWASRVWEEGLEFGLIILQPDGKDQGPSSLTAGSEQVGSMGSAAAAGFIPAAATERRSEQRSP